MIHLLAHLLIHCLAHRLIHSFGLSPVQNTRNVLLHSETMESDYFDLNLPSDGGDAVQTEQSEDECFSLQDKRINPEICGKYQRTRSNFLATPASMTSNVPRRTQRPRARKPFFVLGKRRRFEEKCTGTVVSARVLAGDGPEEHLNG